MSPLWTVEGWFSGLDKATIRYHLAKFIETSSMQEHAMVLTMLGTTILGLAMSFDVEVIAHRGESGDAPENTMAAFRLAWERGVPAIELDVHVTGDGKLVVCHDADAERTSGAPLRIVESTLEELRKLDVGRWKGVQWAGEQMPSLDEALATIPEGRRCFIELKVGPESVPPLVETIQRSGKTSEQLVIISFHADTVAESKRQLPEIPAFFLSSFRRDESTNTMKPGVDELIQTARQLGADGLDLSFKGPIDRGFVQKVHDAGLKLYVWTVDDMEVAKQFAELGVDGITTNHGGRMLRILGSTQTPADASPGR